MRIVRCLFWNLFLLAIVTSAAETTVKPLLAQKLSYAPGRIGKALHVSGETRLQYPETTLSLSGGTVEMWVSLDEAPAKGKQIFFVSNGSNNPDWMFWGLDGVNVNFLARSKKDAKAFHYYSSIRIPFQASAKTWTHFALVWCNVGSGESMVQLYVNGKAVIERFDQSLGEKTATPIGIGHNTAGIGTPAFSGTIDELRISNCPRNAAEILANYQAGLDGKKLAVDEKTLLYVPFEESADGVSNAHILPLQEVRKIGNAMLDKLFGE